MLPFSLIWMNTLPRETILLTRLLSERPKLYTILALLSAKGLSTDPTFGKRGENQNGSCSFSFIWMNTLPTRKHLPPFLEGTIFMLPQERRFSLLKRVPQEKIFKYQDFFKKIFLARLACLSKQRQKYKLLALSHAYQYTEWSPLFPLKGYCTVFQHALISLEITGIVLS